MPELMIAVPSGYDAKTQGLIGVFAASLDDQSRRLKKAVDGLTVEQLEWQLRPGHNTVGMLLMHIAAVEVSWMLGPAQGNLDRATVRANTAMLLNLDPAGDGIPLAADAKHPHWFAGMEIADYIDLLDRARTLVHETLRAWRDPDLDQIYERDGYKMNRRWMLYHILEHQAAHFGQILLILHHLRDAHLLPALH